MNQEFNENTAHSGKARRGIAAMLSLLLLFSVLCVPFGLSDSGKIEKPEKLSGKAPENAQSAHREEVIYATLDTNGALNAAYAVVMLDVKADGVITDYGDYTEVKNLTDTEPITLSGDTVSATAKAGNFYFQGNMREAALPWDIAISYELDGEPILADKLAGASGQLSCEIKTAPNKAADSRFYESYMLQISVTLNSSLCRSISASGASIANAGADKMLNFTVMPGSESKNSFSAEVTNFEMDGISIAAIPFSMDFDIPDLSDMTGGLTQLAKAVSQINTGMSALSGGIAELSGGISELALGSSQFGEGLDALSANADALLSASGEINGALAQVATAMTGEIELSGADLFAVARIMLLPTTLSDIAKSTSTAAGAIKTLTAEFAEIDSRLSDIYFALPTASLDESELARLRGALGTDSALEELISGYEAGVKTRDALCTLNSELSEKIKRLEALSEDLSKASELMCSVARAIAQSFTSSDLLGSFEQLKSGMSELAGGYAQFHSGLSEYLGGVKSAAAGYGELNNGLSQLSGGSAELSIGMKQLSNGMSQLDSQTKQIPSKLDSNIEQLLSAYDYSDFECTSFISDKNEYADAVQFVLVTDKISRSTEAAVDDEPTKDEGFWKRLTELFVK